MPTIAHDVPTTESMVYLALLGALAAAGLLAILLPFVGPIVMGGAMAITVFPFYGLMGRRWPGLSPTVRSLLINLTILTLVILPVICMIRTAAAQVHSLQPFVARWVQAGRFFHGLNRLEDWAAQALAELLRGVFGLLLCPLITFFLLRDGATYLERMRGLIPLHPEDQQRLFERMREATIAIMRGLFLTALLLSAVSTLGYALMGIPSAVLLGVMTGFASVIPVIGTGAVWVPVGVLTILSGRSLPGVFVLAWGTGMCVWVDGFARPWLVGRHIHTGFLPLIFGILGGTAVFGLKGLLIGPLIVSVAPTVFQLARRRFFDAANARMLTHSSLILVSGLLVLGSLPLRAATDPFDDRVAEVDAMGRKGLALLPYYSTYILPFSYQAHPNNEAFAKQYEGKNQQNVEVKYQISIRFPLALDIANRGINLYVAYTQLSFWQAYNDSASSVFRDTTYEPEIFLVFPWRFSLGPVTNHALQVGFVHQSNGRYSDGFDRSWNRLYARAMLTEGRRLVVGVRAWYKMANGLGDNRDIADYYGYGDVMAKLHLGRHTLSLMWRNNLHRSENRGAIELGWTHPLVYGTRWYIQYWDGYGESLIDYNHSSQRIGAGILLGEWM